MTLPFQSKTISFALLDIIVQEDQETLKNAPKEHSDLKVQEDLSEIVSLALVDIPAQTLEQ